MKKCLIINAHPDKESFCRAIADTYYNVAKGGGCETSLINLAELDFNPILQSGYRERTELEPDLLRAIDAIKNADHLVWVFPNWWASFPALLKGFIDRVFLPGIMFEYIPNSYKVKKYLTGKTSRLIITMDSPKWYYRFFMKNPAINIMKKGVLQFCGVDRVDTTVFSPIKSSSLERRKLWLTEVERIAQSDLSISEKNNSRCGENCCC